jgi:hypothetical protein
VVVMVVVPEEGTVLVPVVVTVVVPVVVPAVFPAVVPVIVPVVVSVVVSVVVPVVVTVVVPVAGGGSVAGSGGRVRICNTLAAFTQTVQTQTANGSCHVIDRRGAVDRRGAGMGCLHGG